MNKFLSPHLGLMAAVAIVSAQPVFAEDIDLYAGVNGGGASPNVLFYLDNTSNWSANNQAWSYLPVRAKCKGDSTCEGYVDAIFGGKETLEQGRVELRALTLVLNKLVCSGDKKLNINAGLMMFEPAVNGSADGASATGAYIRQRIAPLDTAHCAEFLADLKSIDDKITENETKTSSSAGYGAGLYEAFKYFGGWTSPAGAAAGKSGADLIGQADSRKTFGPRRYVDLTGYEDPKAFADDARTTYASPIKDGGTCGNNYIVLVGNTWPNADYGTNTNASPNPTNSLMTRLGHDPGAQFYPKPLPNNEKTNVRFGDEWADFLYRTDVSDAPGIQNVRMFTLDVYNASQDLKQAKLLSYMADRTGGGNGYFAVGGDLKALIDAFTDILTQIASVDSVFTSASLPVSVNAQGTFLNQVFMGVFRPDADLQQRWAGNLKQYRFGISGGALYLADADGQPAVDEKNTGFIQHCARSYWTTDSGTYWENLTGLDQPNGCLTSSLSPYSDSPDGPMVERGGAGQHLRALGHANRNIQTCASAACGSLMDFTATNLSGLMDAELVAWLRGENVGDGYNKTDGTIGYTKYGLDATATRPTVHGEVVHSRPLAINYGNGPGDNVVVFYGAGDGTLRAVSGNQTDVGGEVAGDELWAFIAPEHWSKLDRVRTNSPLIKYPNVSGALIPTPQPKTYFFDGSIGGYQERTGPTVTKTLIYPTMRRGGRSVYAFDVTAAPGGATQPILKWRYSETNHANMGQSWSTPMAVRVKGTTNPLVVFGAGYDSCEDSEDPAAACAGVTKGRGIVVTDAISGPGTNTRFIDPGATAGRFPADVTPVDVNNDGYIDVLYAVDTRGNLWRINTSDPAAGFEGYTNGVADWPINLIATVAQWGGSVKEQRKLMYAPGVVALGTQVTVLFGSGDREKPSATSNAAKVDNRFYGIRDKVTVTDPANISVARGYGAGSPDLADLKNMTGLTNVDPKVLGAFKGWFIELSSTSEPYEQVVTTPLTLSGVTYFSTFRAKGTGDSTCSDLGSGRGYRIDFQTGARLPDVPWVETFISIGIPPSPVGGVVSVDDKLVPFCIGCAGPSPLSPTKIIPKIRPDRKPVYRFQRIDR